MLLKEYFDGKSRFASEFIFHVCVYASICSFSAVTLLSLFEGNWDECHELCLLICMSVVRLCFDC